MFSSIILLFSIGFFIASFLKEERQRFVFIVLGEIGLVVSLSSSFVIMLVNLALIYLVLYRPTAVAELAARLAVTTPTEINEMATAMVRELNSQPEGHEVSRQVRSLKEGEMLVNALYKLGVTNATIKVNQGGDKPAYYVYAANVNARNAGNVITVESTKLPDDKF